MVLSGSKAGAGCGEVVEVLPMVEGGAEVASTGVWAPTSDVAKSPANLCPDLGVPCRLAQSWPKWVWCVEPHSPTSLIPTSSQELRNPGVCQDCLILTHPPMLPCGLPCVVAAMAVTPTPSLANLSSLVFSLQSVSAAARLRLVVRIVLFWSKGGNAPCTRLVLVQSELPLLSLDGGSFACRHQGRSPCVPGLSARRPLPPLGAAPRCPGPSRNFSQDGNYW